jgi:hypothetical protein
MSDALALLVHRVTGDGVPEMAPHMHGYAELMAALVDLGLLGGGQELGDALQQVVALLRNTGMTNRQALELPLHQAAEVLRQLPTVDKPKRRDAGRTLSMTELRVLKELADGPLTGSGISRLVLGNADYHRRLLARMVRGGLLGKAEGGGYELTAKGRKLLGVTSRHK